MGVRLPDHLEGFGALATVQLNIDCVSNDDGESTILGDLVQFTILTAQDIIQKEFGFYDLTHPTLGQTVPFERNQTKWNTPVSFSVQFWIRWAQVPIAPLLQQIAQRITASGENASGHFIDATINSFRRGEVFHDPDPGAPLPPSRISIVGPPGPAGPAGPPGAPGSVTIQDALCIDQALTGVINGSNTVFTTAVVFLHDAKFKEIFYVNGQRQKEGSGCDYEISESTVGGGFDTVTMAYAPTTRDQLTIDYYPDTP